MFFLFSSTSNVSIYRSMFITLYLVSNETTTNSQFTKLIFHFERRSSSSSSWRRIAHLFASSKRLFCCVNCFFSLCVHFPRHMMSMMCNLLWMQIHFVGQMCAYCQYVLTGPEVSLTRARDQNRIICWSNGCDMAIGISLTRKWHSFPHHQGRSDLMSTFT